MFLANWLIWHYNLKNGLTNHPIISQSLSPSVSLSLPQSPSLSVSLSLPQSLSLLM